MAMALSKKCACKEAHVHLEGGLTPKSANYAWKLAWVIARASVIDEEEARQMEDVTHEDIDRIEFSELYRELVQMYSVAEVKWIAKIHEQLGHPSPRALALA